MDYFKTNPHVGGMATEDGKIIFNPHSKNVNYDAIGANEASRLFMRQNGITPQFDITPEQAASFKGTEYESDLPSLKQSIVGRIISGDPSAGAITPAQKEFADQIMKSLEYYSKNKEVRDEKLRKHPTSRRLW